jgi:peptidoglycan/xylan/chitin deacetylase (PgdA/CDA1 family)
MLAYLVVVTIVVSGVSSAVGGLRSPSRRTARVAIRWALVCTCSSVVLSACGDSSKNERAPEPAPSVTLTADERAAWAVGRPDRSSIPVLRYQRIDRERFARHMALLSYAGYETITLDAFVRFVRGQDVRLPPRPLLLTFDGGRLDSWIRGDAILRERGFNAVIFVNVGRTEREHPAHLTYDELDRLQASGRWDVQLQAGNAGGLIKYGPADDDVGPFNAYRGAEEVLGGWRERVFGDISYGEEQLTHHVEGYRPLAFAPPYGNYGQAGTNDPRIPRELLPRLLLSFAVVFTQDRSAFAKAGASNPFGRIDVTPDVDAAGLRALLAH